MKLVTFNRAMRAQGFNAGEQRLVPDDVAARLETNGEIDPSPPSWPPAADATAAERPRNRSSRRLLNQTYLTR